MSKKYLDKTSNTWNNSFVNLPNIITLIRIPFLFIIASLLFIPAKGALTIAFILYVLAGITDWLDGHIARKYNQISDLGKLLDALNDKIFTVGIFLLLIAKQLIPTWGVFCVLIIVCREFLITGLRIILAKTGTVMAAENLGKVKTVLQIVVMGSYLLIEMLRIDAANWFPSLGLSILSFINSILFIVATISTTYSGIRYFIKYRKFLEI